jgi:hypothetical protein
VFPKSISGTKKPPKNGEDFGGQKINNMKHKNSCKGKKKTSTPQGMEDKNISI